MRWTCNRLGGASGLTSRSRRPCQRHPVVLAGVVLLALGTPERAFPQCQLGNPSFEIPGPAGQPFGGWTTFGLVDTCARASHGHVAARIHGTGGGGWDLSGLWQPLDSNPGEIWAVGGRVAHFGASPLTGSSVALVNVEWRSAADELIGFDSYPVATAGSPPDEDLPFSLSSSLAPPGTTRIRLVLGLLQEPGQPAPLVCFDQITCWETSPPDLDDAQWVDFPGGRHVEFAGRDWRVKGPGWYGPGPNLFSDSHACVSVDPQGRLHLGIRFQESAWRCSEVALEDTLGYGDYIFTTVGALDQLHVRTVFGLFLWQYGPCYNVADSWWNPNNEFDIEFSRWGDPANAVGQFVAQPWDWAGNISRFDAMFAADEVSSHAFRWLSDRVECRSWRGGPQDEAPETLIHQLTYAGPHIPRPEQPRVHLNLWQAGAAPDTEQEVVLETFTFVPAGGSTDLSPPAVPRPHSPILRLHPPAPNPGNPGMTIRYALTEAGSVEVAIFDLTGRRVRTLAQGPRPAGLHATQWDGRNDAGTGVAGGLYLCRLRQGARAEVQRLLLIP